MRIFWQCDATVFRQDCYNASPKAGPSSVIPRPGMWFPGRDAHAWDMARYQDRYGLDYWAGPWPNDERVNSRIMGPIALVSAIATAHSLCRAKDERNSLASIRNCRPYNYSHRLESKWV